MNKKYKTRYSGKAKRTSKAARSAALRTRGGFAASPPNLIRISRQLSKLVERVPESSRETVINRYAKKLAAVSDTITVGTTVYQKIKPIVNDIMGATMNDQEIASHSRSSKPTVTAQGILSGKRHHVHFVTGKRSTRSIESASRENGDTTRILYSSIREYDGSSTSLKRIALFNESGFNRKEQWMYTGYSGVVNQVPGYWSVDSLWKYFTNANYTPSDADPVVTDSGQSAVTYYSVKYLRSKWKISNANSFLPCIFKIHMIPGALQSTAPESDFANRWFTNAGVETTPVAQTTGALPSILQFTNVEQTGGRTGVVIDPKSRGFMESDSFKATYEKVAKSFKFRLNPGDSIEFTHTHNCGPGIIFDVLTRMMVDTSAIVENTPQEPVSYMPIFECVGVPVNIVKVDNPSIRLTGTSPWSITTEVEHSMRHVRTRAGSVPTTAAGAPFNDRLCHFRQYVQHYWQDASTVVTKDSANQRTYNIDPANITNDGSKIYAPTPDPTLWFLPLTSDAFVAFAGGTVGEIK